MTAPAMTAPAMTAQAMTADVLRDYMLGRLYGTERRRLRDRLRADPRLRGALFRLQDTTTRVRARLGGLSSVGQAPADWLPLIEQAARRLTVREEAPPKTWLRAGAFQRDERSLTWL